MYIQYCEEEYMSVDEALEGKKPTESVDGKVQVLMVSSDADYHSHFVRQLDQTKVSGKYTLMWIADFEIGLEAVAEGGYGVVFVDQIQGKHMSGSHNGIEFVREAKKDDKQPLYLLTDDPRAGLDAMKAGARSYLIKEELTAKQIETCFAYSKRITRRLTVVKPNNTEEAKK